jgi:hypothetical protein
MKRFLTEYTLIRVYYESIQKGVDSNMFYIHTKNGQVYNGFIYNQDNEKLEDALTINKEIANDLRLVITGRDEVVISSVDIKFVVKEKSH